MEVEFDVSLDDHLAFYLYRQQKSPAIRRYGKRYWLVRIVGSACLIAGLLILADSLPGGAAKLIWALVAAVAAYIAILPWRQRKAATALLRNQLLEWQPESLSGRRHVSVSPDGIKATSALCEVAAKWSAVQEIVVSDKHAFVFMGARGAFIIPKHAFPDDSEFRAFVETAGRFRREAS